MKNRAERSFTAELMVIFPFVIFVVSQSIAVTAYPACPEKPHVFTRKEGNFSSPGGGTGYKNNTCTRWFVQAPLSAKVMVIFHGFDLEPSKTCQPYDFVLMQEQCNETAQWTNVGSYFCGNRTKFNITSTCGRVVLIFRSDDSYTGAGFNATYKVIRNQQKPSIDCLGVNCTRTQTEVATSTAYLECEVSGHPTPKTYWKRINSAGERTALPLNIRDENNGTLIIRDVKIEDSGLYYCYANSSMGDDMKELKLHVKEKCKCPKIIRTNWYDLAPYVKLVENKDPEGVFPVLIQRIVNTCCGNCTLGDGPSIISYGKPQDSLEAVKQTIIDQDTLEISFPITGKKDDRTFNNDKKFYPLFSSPGVAFIVVDAEPGTSAKAVFQSVLGGWPILLLTMLMAMLSGQVMWALDTWYNPDEFPRSFIKGSGEGFWWAFVTMTTVGYGDRSPRGFLARIFAIVWVLIGIVITSVFTGVVTTSLTAITLSTDVKLYGTKVGAVQNSTEYKLGITKNANMRAFQNLDELVYALKNRHDGLKGALVDTYVAGEVKEFDDKGLRVNKIVDYASYYGIVFGDGQMAETEFQKCLDDYVLAHKAEISKTIEARTKPMKKPSESAAVEKSSGLFDAESQLFKDAVYTCLGLLLFLAALGILWDYGYIRHWKKKSELEELEMIGGPGYEIAKHNLEMMDSMMQEVQDFYESWTKRLDDICARHEEEQKLLAKRQGSKK